MSASSNVRATLRPMFLFDVADSIAISGNRKEGRAHGPRYLGFEPPPLVTASEEARVALFAFGVAGVTYSIPFEGDWDALVREAARLQDDGGVFARARQEAAKALESHGKAVAPYEEWLSEDYLIVETATGMVNEGAIARIVRGEVLTLSTPEVQEVMSSALQCYPGDLLVVGWAAAFVADTVEGAQSSLQLLEFANAQLLELRHYDGRAQHLVRQLYRLQAKRRGFPFARWWVHREAARLNEIRLESMDLMERSDNALRVLGDMFYARAHKVAAQRIGVDDYRRLLEEKLKTAGELYQFQVDEFNHSRAFLLEFLVVVILIVELAMALWGRRH